MKKIQHGISRSSRIVLIFFSLVVASCCLIAAEDGSCQANGSLTGKDPPPGKCNKENNADCCEDGKLYNIFECSPPVTQRTKAILTLNSFESGGDGGGESKCDGEFHSDDKPVVALSTGWFSNMGRCHKSIVIYGNGGNMAEATVVDECDSKKGCDEQHDFQVPCRNNVVDASRTVWKALGVPEEEWGELDIEWSDA